MRFNAFNKYKNQKVKTSAGTFDSKLELKHYNELVLLQKAKRISYLNKQVRIKLGKNAKVYYIADFVYFDNVKNELVIADSKGIETDTFKVKLKWLLDTYSNFRFELIKRNDKKILYPYNDTNADFKAFYLDYMKEQEKKLIKKIKNA